MFLLYNYFFETVGPCALTTKPGHMYPKNLRPQPGDRTAGLLSAKEAARLLGVNQNTLCKWSIRGVEPRFVKAGTTVSATVLG
jgi:hypothetical protein